MKFIRNQLLNRVEPRLLLALTVLGGLLLAFAKISEDVVEEESHAFDRAILLALRLKDDPSMMIGPHWLALAMRDITSLGGFTLISLITLLSVLYLTAARQYRNAAIVTLAITFGALAERGLKLLFSRPRPEIVPHLVEVQTMSFPSGHAMMSAITYLTLGAMLARAQPTRRLRVFVILSGLLLTLLSGTSRVFLGVHYPTDILAGWTVGGAWALMVWMIADWLNRQDRGETKNQSRSDPPKS
ncbi:phosphatase PAP2 family protein [Allorhizobium sp. BGMRC 0089]|uniref:phosphatase PAP2 family protein n=1 Tax=Allorhizobium sonneratiae TaxID=2934936 RepID=UPI00203324E1|nr:phosphatase PAP2 family protein [Allorhizobium sonneratiae]MCM2293736.1 phosphatase PAP2 family protein [Allorhizobium sonneratiae]